MKKVYSGCGDMEKRVGKMCGGKIHRDKKYGGGYTGGPSSPQFTPVPDNSYRNTRAGGPSTSQNLGVTNAEPKKGGGRKLSGKIKYGGRKGRRG